MSRFLRQMAVYVYYSALRAFFLKTLAPVFGGTEQSENIPDGYFPPYSYELSGLVVRSSCLENSCESPRKKRHASKS